MQTTSFATLTTSPTPFSQSYSPIHFVNRGSWFPSHPKCPNHISGATFNSAYADPGPDGHVSCPDCFLHSTIMQSVSCQHLHACHDCAFCYAQQHPNLGGHSPSLMRQGTSSPLYVRSSPVMHGVSPPLLNGSPQPLSARSSPFDHTPNRQFTPPQTCSYNHGTDVTYHPSLSGLSAVQSDLHKPIAACTSPAASFSQIRSTPPRSRASTNLTYSLSAPGVPLEYSDTSRLSHTFKGVEECAERVPNIEGIETVKRAATLLSVNQSEKQNSTPVAPKKDSSVRKRSADDLCQVCGDRASGYHYNALTCEGCKGFFRRSINKRDVPTKCKFGGSCEMDTYTRRKCPYCRLQKCRAVGMLEECLLTEIQCQSKRRSRKMRKLAEEDSQPVQRQNDDSSSTTVVSSESRNSGLNMELVPVEHIPVLTPKDQQIVKTVGKAFKDYRTNPEIVQRWEKYIKNASSLNLCEISTVHVQVLVEFTKKLPGFNHLESEDQIAILKGSFVEAMILRNCCGYHFRKSSLNIEAVTKDTGLKESNMKILIEFFTSTSKLEMDDSEFGLLIAVIMFDSDHHKTQNKAKIDSYRDVYLSTLSRYCKSRKPYRNQVLAKMLALMTEMRTLYHTYTQLVSAWKEREQLTPLLCEIWDLS